MALYKSAQFYDINDNKVAIEDIADEGDVVLYDEKPTEHEVLEMHSEPHAEEGHAHEPHPGEIVELEFKLPELPGSLVPVDISDGVDMEVDGDDKEEEPKAKKEDKNSVDEVEESDPWSSWRQKGPKHTVNWAKEMLGYIPKHTGVEVAGLQRSQAFLERLLKELSTAIRGDLMGDIDIAEFEQVRKEIVNGIGRLEDRVKQLEGKPKKKAAGNEDRYTQLVKEAQRAAGISGIVVTVPLIISTIARTAINSMVSAGKDIEKVVDQLIKQYDLSKREQAELLQHLADMNVTIRRPRCLELDKDWDPTSSDNLDYSAQYTA